MGTHAVIAIQYNETINAVYCHFDGYLEHVGNILQEHYNTEEKIDEIIVRGDMSSLGETIKECKFYEDSEFKVYIDAPFMSARERLLTFANSRFASYLYLFVEGTWIMTKTQNFKL